MPDNSDRKSSGQEMEGQKGKPATSSAGKKIQKRSRRAIVVLGMHRSGTSALTRTLSYCGAHLPVNLMRPGFGLPGDGNRRVGYWESSAITGFDDELLAAAGSSWSDLAGPDPDWFQSKAAEIYKERLFTIVSEEFNDTPLIVVKDPRISRIVPLWRTVLNQSGFETQWLIAVRNPLEVAASLATRDGISLPMSLLLWLEHLLAAERDTRAFERCFVTFEGLLADWRATMSRVSREFNLDLSPSKAVAGEIDSFLDRSLRHHVILREELAERPEVPTWVKAAFELANNAADGGTVDSAGFDEIARALNDAVAAFVPLLSAGEERLAREAGRATERDEELSGLRQELEHREQEMARLSTELAIQTRHLEKVIPERREETEELLGRVRRMDELSSAQRIETEATRTENEERTHQIEELLTRVRKLDELSNLQQAEIEAAKAVSEERTHQIEELLSRVRKMDQDLTNKQENTEKLQIAISDRDRQIDHLLEQDKMFHEERRAQHVENYLQLKGLSETIESQKEKLSEHADEIGRLGGTISMLYRQLKERDTAIEIHRTRTDESRNKVTGLRAEVRCLNQQIAEIQRTYGTQTGRPCPSSSHAAHRKNPKGVGHALKTLLWFLLRDLPNRRKKWEEEQLIFESHLFDETYYLTAYPDVADAKIDPYSHYYRGGATQGRNPNPLFDSLYYLTENPDVAEVGMNPLVHFILSGAAEGRSPSSQFDTTYYLRNNPEVAGSGMNPLLHYLEIGIWRGRAPRRPASDVLGDPTPARTFRADEPRGPSVEIDCGCANLGEPITGPGIADPETPPPAQHSGTKVPTVRTIAFYLPQFHPVPENNEWWGPGFTEWTNVARAEPLFPGHEQPEIPSELGFYDLRLPEIREQQAQLARDHGINGFCYYYYWFNGREILERPLWEMVESGSPDLPFCLCWANENWTRRWDGYDSEILLAQEQDSKSDAKFIDTIMPALLDPRYICVDGKPMLLVYRADLLADPQDTTRRWREAAKGAGLPGLHLCAVEYGLFDPRPLGFDALIEFPPHSLYQQGIAKEIALPDKSFSGRIFDFAASAAAVFDRPSPDFPLYRGVMPRWDNTPRRGKEAWIYHGSTPEVYGTWLRTTLREATNRPGSDEQFVFINAWNEWAEGAHLEPSLDLGRSYLEETREAVRENQFLAAHIATRPQTMTIRNSSNFPWRMNQEHETSRAPDRRSVLLVGHDAARAGSQLVLLNIIKHLSQRKDLELFLLLRAGGEVEGEFTQYIHVLNLENVTAGDADKTSAVDQIVAEFSLRDPLLAICNSVATSNFGMACKRAGIPVLSMVYELPTSIESSLGRQVIEQALESSNRIIVASEFVRDALVRRYSIEFDRLTPLYIGFIDWESTPGWKEAARKKVLEEFSLPHDTFLVLGCGTIHHRKGTDVFVQVAREVMAMDGSERFNFVWIGGDQVGPSFRQWCEHDVETAGLKNRVLFPGGRENIGDYYAAADAFALTSREDPFPLVTLESMARGLPVLAFDGAGGSPEALSERAGIVVPYLDTKAMARSLICLCEAPQYRAEIGRNAKEKAESKFSWKRFIGDLLTILSEDFGYQPGDNT